MQCEVKVQPRVHAAQYLEKEVAAVFSVSGSLWRCHSEQQPWLQPASKRMTCKRSRLCLERRSISHFISFGVCRLQTTI